MFDKCRGQHSDCDICDGMRHDPDTGWGGFVDHFAKKHFSTDKNISPDEMNQREKEYQEYLNELDVLDCVCSLKKIDGEWNEQECT